MLIEREVEFCICSGSSIVKQVNERLAQGWRLHGTIFHTAYTYTAQVPDKDSYYGQGWKDVEKTGTTFHQAMVRVESEVVAPEPEKPVPRLSKRPLRVSRSGY